MKSSFKNILKILFIVLTPLERTLSISPSRNHALSDLQNFFVGVRDRDWISNIRIPKTQCTTVGTMAQSETSEKKIVHRKIPKRAPIKED
jgi:hypothetical protein